MHMAPSWYPAQKAQERRKKNGNSLHNVAESPDTPLSPRII